MMIHDIGLQFHILLRNGKTDMNCSIPIDKHIRFCNQMSIRNNWFDYAIYEKKLFPAKWKLCVFLL